MLVKTINVSAPKVSRAIDDMPINEPETATEAIDVWGEAIVLKFAIHAWRIQFAQRTRSKMELSGDDRKNDKKILAEMLDAVPTIGRERVGKVEKTKRMVADMTEAEKAELLASLQA